MLDQLIKTRALGNSLNGTGTEMSSPQYPYQEPAPSSTPPQPNLILTSIQEPPKTAGSTFKKVFIIFFILLLLLGVTVGGAVAYLKLFRDPKKILTTSWTKMEQVSSLTTTFSMAPDPKVGNLSLTLDYHKDLSKFSKLDLAFSEISGDLKSNLATSIIFNQQEVFILPSYSKLAETEAQISVIYPEILSLQTYQLLKPVLEGKSWFHIKIPPEEASKLSGEKYLSQIDQKKAKELETQFLKSILVRSFNDNFSQDNQKFYKMSLGFDKKELLKLIDGFKDLNLDIALSDINSLTKIVESVENWDDDLIEVLIEKKTGNLYSLSLSLPEIPTDVLEKNLKESVEKEKSSPYFSKLFSESITPFLKKRKGGRLEYLGKIVFTNYNNAPLAQKPNELVEFEAVLTAAKEELLPLIQVMMSGQMSGQPPSNGTIPGLPKRSPSPSSSPSPKQTPILVTPTPASKFQVKFQSAGEKTIENGLTARITSAWEEGNNIKIRVIFSNTSTSTKSARPVRVTMLSQTKGTGDNTSLLELPLSTGEKKTLDLSYTKLPDPPFKWNYTTLSGEKVELGSYTP